MSGRRRVRRRSVWGLLRFCLILIAAAAFVLPVSMVLAKREIRVRFDAAVEETAAKGEPYVLHVPPPPAVRRAGGRELREFKEGRSAVAAAGCEACHRIGDQGNRGPGSPLTHIGSKLTVREIREALRNPRAPMPSFKGMPRHKLHVIIRFLSLLRSSETERSV